MYYKLFSNIKFIILTGENRVGKDTVADMLYSQYKNKKFNVQILSLATPLKTEFLKNKENKNKNLKDESVRKELYELSLKIKKIEGNTYFCRKLFEQIESKTNVVIIPDMRFKEEFSFFNQEIKNMYVIKIIKKGSEGKESDDFFVSYDVHTFIYDQLMEV